MDNMHQQSHDSYWSAAMHTLGITKAAHEIESSDITGKTMADITEWNTFYATYSRLKGFGVRSDKVRRDNNNNVCQRRWVCSREGFREKKWYDLEGRKRTPKAITRIGCKAGLTVTHDKEAGQWVATTFVADHNHDLASPSELHFLRSHRVLPNSVVVQAKSMKFAGIRTISILDYISMQCGGRSNLPFLKKDMYNKLARCRQHTGQETDSEGALGYLTCVAMREGNFFCRFNVDENARLHTIFWSDSTSRSDYSLFGEVMAFDTTYRTNAYNKPLMIMVGVNHHYRTTVFGVALLADETAETYIWVLKQFLECMDGRQPNIVVTDGDLGMRAAISEVLTQAKHRLCAWHLDANATSNVPIGEFKIRFRTLMYRFYTENEFDEHWNEMVQENNLEQNPWVTSMYNKRHCWAETFLRGNFIGGMRTTQRCESMNAYMRRFLDSRHLLRDFVSQIDQGIQHIRLTEMEDDFKTRHTEAYIPANDPLALYYRQFGLACTRNIYEMIAKEINAHNSYTVSYSEYTMGMQVFRLAKFRYGEIRHAVTHSANSNQISCACLLLETDGIPCRHIFTVMKHLNIQRVPDCLIKQQWRKDAKTSPHLHRTMSPSIQDVMQQGRFGTLATEFNTLAMYASKYQDTFEEARKHLATLTETFQTVCTLREGVNINQQHHFNEKEACSHNVIRDPITARTKGREKEANKGPQPTAAPFEPHRKRCRLCNQLGHNKATCTKRNISTESLHQDHPQGQHSINLKSSHHATTSEQGLNETTWFNEILNSCPSTFNQEGHVSFADVHQDNILPQNVHEHIPLQGEQGWHNHTLTFSTNNFTGNFTTDEVDEH